MKNSKPKLKSKKGWRPKRLRKMRKRKTKRIMIRNPTIRTMIKTKTKQVAITLRATVIRHLTSKTIPTTSDAH